LSRVEGDPYTFTDDLAEEIAGENENEQRSTEEVLLSAIDGLQDDKPTGFALRLALMGHVAIPREGEFFRLQLRGPRLDGWSRPRKSGSGSCAGVVLYLACKLDTPTLH
jgi:hypothetical protein